MFVILFLYLFLSPHHFVYLGGFLCVVGGGHLVAWTERSEMSIWEGISCNFGDYAFSWYFEQRSSYVCTHFETISDPACENYDISAEIVVWKVGVIFEVLNGPGPGRWFSCQN